MAHRKRDMSLPAVTTAEDAGSGAALQMRLFGPFQVRLQGVPLPPLRTRKGAWLLALLVLRRDRPVERTWLAGTLWPESGHRESLKSLRESLHDLRKALGSQAARLISPTPGTLRLDLAQAEVDLLAFDAALVRGSEALEQAIQLYRGPLLEGCTEEWAFAERERREQAYLSTLETLAERATARHQPTAALRYLRLIISTNPMHETAYAALMQALSSCGDYAAVTQVYRDLRPLLHHELHVTPSPDIEALYRHLQEQAKQAQFAPPSPSPPPPRRLPVPFSSLIGRQQEISTVIAMQQKGRLVTLVGTGGVGKTRLAI